MTPPKKVLTITALTMVVVVLIAGLAFWGWWHYALPMSLNQVHAELREQGIASRWQDVEDRRLSSSEDIQRVDALYAAMHEWGSTEATQALMYWGYQEDIDVDEGMAHYDKLDHSTMAFISEELRQWYQDDPEPVRRWEAPNLHEIKVLEGITARRSWAMLGKTRARLPLSQEDRAAAITSIAHLLAPREERSLIAMLVDISIAAIALGTMAENQDLWDDHGEAFLRLMEPWCRTDYWHSYLTEAMLIELRIASSLINGYGSPNEPAEGLSANGMQIRLSAARALRDHGAGIRLLRDHSGDLRDLISAARNLDATIRGSQGWWSRQRSKLTEELGISLHSVIERWVQLCLTYAVLRHEMGHGPWPQDPWAAPGTTLRRYPEDGPLQRVWSVGPDGIDQGGGSNPYTYSDDIDLHWPQP